MIIVTGTRGAGTSIWLEVLRAAGLPPIGDAFPRDSADGFAAVNPETSVESPFRDGIHCATNPDPESGFYLHPGDVRDHVAQVSVPGLTRTDLAYVDRVIVCVCDFREHHAVSSRIHRAEVAHAREQPARDAHGVFPAPLHVTPCLEWWYENHALWMDAFTRRYPVHVVTHARLFADPERTVGDVIDWLGRGERGAALDAARRELARSDRTVELSGLIPEGLDAVHAETFDALHDRLHRGVDFDADFIDRLHDTHLALAPRLDDERRLVEARRMRRLGHVPERTDVLDLPERSET